MTSQHGLRARGGAVALPEIGAIGAWAEAPIAARRAKKKAPGKAGSQGGKGRLTLPGAIGCHQAFFAVSRTRRPARNRHRWCLHDPASPPICISEAACRLPCWRKPLRGPQRHRSCDAPDAGPSTRIVVVCHQVTDAARGGAARRPEPRGSVRFPSTCRSVSLSGVRRKDMTFRLLGQGRFFSTAATQDGGRAGMWNRSCNAWTVMSSSRRAAIARTAA